MGPWIVAVIGVSLLLSCQVRRDRAASVKSFEEVAGETTLRLSTIAITRADWADDFRLINEAYASALPQLLIDVSRRLDGITAAAVDKPILRGFIKCGILPECDKKRQNLEALIESKAIGGVKLLATYKDQIQLDESLRSPTLLVQEISIDMSGLVQTDLEKLRRAFATNLAKKLADHGFQMGRSEFAAVKTQLDSQLLTGVIACVNEAACDEQKLMLEGIKGIQAVAFMGVTMGPAGNKAGGGSDKTQ